MASEERLRDAPPHKAIIVFVESVNRLGYTADEIAEELASLARNKADWPRLSRDQWLDVIDAALIDGKLSRSANGVITLAVIKPAVKRVETVEKTVKQLELF
jgi:hypothetical protein